VFVRGRTRLRIEKSLVGLQWQNHSFANHSYELQEVIYIVLITTAGYGYQQYFRVFLYENSNKKCQK